MDADERKIYYYLKNLRGQFVWGRDIGRGAGSRSEFRRRPDWALLALGRMVERGILETGPADHYRIKPRPKMAGEKYMSPQIASILKASGKDFAGLTLKDDDAYYDSL